MFRKFGLFICLLAPALPAAAQTASPIPACDIIDEQVLNWEALGETVTLRTKLQGEEGYLPGAEFTMVLSDETEVELGSGGKFIDDFDPQDPPGCADHLEAATRPILNSVTGDGAFYYSGNFRSMIELDTALHKAEFCKSNNLDYYQTGNGKKYVTEVEKSGSWESQFLTCGPILDRIAMGGGTPDTSAKDYRRLLAQNAPLIEVPYSTYGVEIFALDRENLKLYKLITSGC